MKTSSFLRITTALAGIALSLASLHSEIQTLTDKQGRSIKADVLSVENEKVKIKRDDGQTFELPLASLDGDTQRSLKEWAAKAASQIPAGAITIELSRGVFDSTKRDEIGIITTEENWGYNLTASNRSSKPINNLKFDYVLFVKPDYEPGKDENASKLKRATGSHSIDQLTGGTKSAFRTKGIKIYKQKLQPGYVWSKTRNTEMIRDTLHGVWIKAYAGGQLVAEICSPESLTKTEKGP
jgi:hypothetical protein